MVSRYIPIRLAGPMKRLISNDASYALLSNQHNESRNGVFTSIFDCISYVVRQVLLSNLPTTQYPQYLQHLYLCKIITAVFHLDIPPRGARRGHEGRFVSLLVYFARCGSTAGWRLAGYSPLLPCSFLSPFSVFCFGACSLIALDGTFLWIADICICAPCFLFLSPSCHFSSRHVLSYALLLPFWGPAPCSLALRFCLDNYPHVRSCGVWVMLFNDDETLVSRGVCARFVLFLSGWSIPSESI